MVNFSIMVTVILTCGVTLACIADYAYAFDAFALPPLVGFDPHQGILIIGFPAEVDPSSVDVDKIVLGSCANDTCTVVPLLNPEIRPRTLHAYIPPDLQALLLDAAEPTVSFQAGAYMSASDGRVNDHKEVPVIMTGGQTISLLKDVKYTAHLNEIELRFARAVDASSVNPDRIYLSGLNGSDWVTAPITGWTSLRAGGDNKSAVLEPSTEHREMLLYLTGLVLHATDGSYRSFPDGTANRFESVPVYLLEDPRRAWVGEDALLLFGKYLADTNKLYVYFIDEINPFWIAAPRISIGSDRAAITLSAAEFVGVGEDGRSIVFELSPSNRYDLSLMANRQMHVSLEPGAVLRADDGEAAGAERVLFEVYNGHDFRPLNPAIPTDVLLGRVEYNMINKITMYFHEPIDPSSVNASRITISGSHHCVNITLREDELVGVGEDGRSLTFELGRLRNTALRNMDNTWMQLEQGAFRTAANGTANNEGRVPVPDDPHNRYGSSLDIEFARMWLPCHITYSIESPDDILRSHGYNPSAYRESVMAAVDDGFRIWAELNPGITVERISVGEPNIAVRWLGEESRVGGNSCACLRPGAFIGITLVTTQFVNPYGAIADVTAHEFGHNLGLYHTSDKTHLMAGVDSLVRDPFDDLGLNIPDGEWYSGLGN